ncbi:MAG: hypothetical protein ABSG34_18350, partial [Candidatus Sulfotelmatobacter sp.]
TVPELAGKWTTMLQSASTRWNGPEPDLPATITLEADRDLRISPYSFLVLKRLSMLSEAE